MGNTMGGDTPRRADDAYHTPDALALAICERLRGVIGTPGYIIEPSAGEGAFVRAARATWPVSYLVAVEPNGQPSGGGGAAVWLRRTWEDAAPKAEPRPHLIVGNPPFSLAEAHARLALDSTAPCGHVAFLLRASILATVGRVEGLWREHPPRWVWHVAPRPSFTGGGTDGAEYAVVVWQRGWVGPYEGGWLTWTPPPRAARKARAKAA